MTKKAIEQFLKEKGDLPFMICTRSKENFFEGKVNKDYLTAILDIVFIDDENIKFTYLEQEVYYGEKVHVNEHVIYLPIEEITMLKIYLQSDYEKIGG